MGYPLSQHNRCSGSILCGNRAIDIDLAEKLIDDIDTTIAAHRDAGRQHVFTGYAGVTALTDDHQQLTLWVEQLDIAEGGVDDIDVVMWVDGDTLGAGKLAG